MQGKLSRLGGEGGWELSYFLMLLRFSKRLVAKMYLMSGFKLLAETSDSKKERELADLFSYA
jgi:hypothetical protein